MKYKEIQEECQNLKHLNTELESSLRDAISVGEKSKMVIETLRMEETGKGKEES